MNFGKFDQKTVEKSIINTIFKQQVISEPQKLLHFSSARALIAYKLVSCKKSVLKRRTSVESAESLSEYDSLFFPSFLIFFLVPLVFAHPECANFFPLIFVRV